MPPLRAACVPGPHGFFPQGRGRVAAAVQLAGAAQGGVAGNLQQARHVQEAVRGAQHPPGQAGAGGAGLCDGEAGDQVCAAAALQPGGVLRGLLPNHAPHLRAVSRVGPHRGALAVCGGAGDVCAHQQHLAGAGPGSQGPEVHRGRGEDGQLGGAAELPPGGKLDDDARENMRRHQPRQHTLHDPAVAHVVPFPALPGGGAAKRDQDDQRAAHGHARQHPSELPQRPGVRP
mmetsp:Transcript_36239/g.69499  ORF Transcript_36239/g.69499 Transcript_36239/m.69499 type:complete len:231 (+) Transcript_36239:741-1433(+)